MVPPLVLARITWCALLVVALRTELPTQPPRSASAIESKIQSAETPQTFASTVRRICRVTAYCDRGITAAGIHSGVGQCAAPGDIPLGSLVYIPELNRTLVVTDRTHKRFRHNTVDIFIPSRDACLQFGRQYLECHFMIVSVPPRYGTLDMGSYQVARAN